jgi:hypothetical protein
MFSNIAQVLYAEAFQSAFQHDGSLLAKGAAANEACAFDVDLSGRQWGDGYTWLHESCRLKMIHAGTKKPPEVAVLLGFRYMLVHVETYEWCPRETRPFYIIRGLRPDCTVRDTGRDTR